MYILFLLGRIALVAMFIVAGVLKLMDIAASAKLLQMKFTIPAALATLSASLEAFSGGMSTYQLMVIVAAVLEIAFALLIIFNLGTRFSAIVLLIYVAVVTFYANDFWNQSGDVFTTSLAIALRNLSIMGALLLLFVIGPWRPEAFDEDDEYGA